MSRFSPGFIKPSGAVANVMSVSFIASQTLNANATVQTFNNGGSGFDFGAANADLWALAALYAGTAGARVPSGLTIGGTAATRIVRTSAGTGRMVDLYYLNLPGGGAQNLVATFGGSNNGSVAAWRMVGKLDVANITTSIDNSTLSFTPTFASKVGAAGIALGVVSSGNAVTFTEPPGADYATNETATTTYRFVGGHTAPIPGSTWQPQMSIASGSGAAWGAASFPPL